MSASRSCRLLVVSVVLLVVASPRRSAQGAPQIQVQADTDTVGVGDVLHLEHDGAERATAMPTDPQPGATPGFVVRGQSSSPSQTHISINGNRIDRFGLTVDWALQAQRVGVFSVGPPSVSVGGSRYAARAVTVRVVPAGQAPQRPQQPAAAPAAALRLLPVRSLAGALPRARPRPGRARRRSPA